MMKKATICVYCASSGEIDRRYKDEAYSLGRLIAAQGWDLVNGAGNEGLMCAVSDGALSVGGTVIGVIPTFMVHAGWCHEGLTRLVETDHMHERKQQMAEMADACIALPGGCGTIEELMEVITWKTLGIYPKPIVILNTGGYYQPLLDMLQKSVDERFMRERNKEAWTVAATPEEAIAHLQRQLED